MPSTVARRAKTFAVLAAALAVLSAPPAWSQNVPPGQDEALAWREVRGNADPAALERFLERFPAGRYRTLAFRCLVEARLVRKPDGCPEGDPGPPTQSSAARGLALEVY